MLLDKKVFTIYMGFFAENSGELVSEARLELYFEMLKDISTADFKKGAKHLFQNRKYKSFPQIAEIRQACKIEVEQEAISAWSSIEKAIRDLGRNAQIRFYNQIAHSALDSLGGWSRVCVSKPDQLSFLKSDFLKAYVFLKENESGTASAQATCIGLDRSELETRVIVGGQL